MSALTDLNKELENCYKCDISRARNRVVPGEGAEGAEVMFIGEAPGFHEDQQGRPFVGPAGQFLDRLLALINLTREQVYIANVIKCRPTGNRDPLPTEITNCEYWLNQQIEIIKPKLIVTLGRYSMARYFPGKSISKIHGTASKESDIIYFAMYHPAAALHQQSLKQSIEADMMKIPQLLAESQAIPEDEPKPQQLNMFEV